MAHNHKHDHNHGMLLLDTLAAHSGLRGVHPGIKTGFSVLTLVLCVAAGDIVVGITVALSMILLMRFWGKVHVSQIFTLLRIPLLFLIISCVVILLEFSPAPKGTGLFSVGNTWVCITEKSFWQAITLFFQAMGAVCCLYFLSSSTPISQLIEILRRCHMPELVIELMYLIYRYLFVLLDVQQNMTIAASARLGYSTNRRSLTTAGRISGALLASSFRRSRSCFDAMESRGYDEKLSFLFHMPPFRWGHFIAAAVYSFALLALILIRKGGFML